ncbi:MAG: D-xylose 1-dehydrogenase Gfo6 [Halorientalis sp.]
MDLAGYFDRFEERDWQRTAPDEPGGPLRVAMIGVGWWVREFAVPAVAKTDRCETTVLVSSDREKAERVAADCGAEAGITYEQFHDGAAADAYDAVYVCTPNALHLEYVETAGDLGKAVLCEKPMAASADRAAEMVAAARDVPLMVAYRMHTDPAVRRMREAVRDGLIGDPVLVDGHMSQRLLEVFDDPDQWRLDPGLVGDGSSVTDIGIYPLNTARFVLDRDPVAVTAAMASEGEAFDAVPDERAAFTVTYEGGVQASLSASQNAHAGGHLRVVGTEGEMDLSPAFFMAEDRTLTVRRGGTTADVQAGTVDQMEEEFAYFADRVLAGEPVEPDGEHGLLDVRAIEAVYESARTGRRVEL